MATRSHQRRDTGDPEQNSTTWINDGEKYGLVGVSVKVDGYIPQGPITPNLWVLADTTFAIPLNWREWLGSIRAREVEDCNLFLLSKQTSSMPDILDDENNKLTQRAWNFYVGLLLASTFAPAHRPVMLTGVRRAGKIDIRQQHDLDSPIPCLFRPYPPVVSDDLQRAAHVGSQLDALATAALPDGHWRLFRTLHVYTESRTTAEIVDRLHQYSRCIDGLILPDAGKTKQQFRTPDRTLHWPSPSRSDGRYLRCSQRHRAPPREPIFGGLRPGNAPRSSKEGSHCRTHRADRTCKDHRRQHRLGAFRKHPCSREILGLSESERQRIWGDPIDPMDAIVDFDPKYIHDGLLGAP